MYLLISWLAHHDATDLHVNSLNPKLPFGYIILRTAQKRQDSLCVLRVCCISRKRGTGGGGIGGGGWGHPQGDMHMVAARLSCQNAMVGTMWANSCPGCMDRL